MRKNNKNASNIAALGALPVLAFSLGTAAHATSIVAIPSRDGLIVIADKRYIAMNDESGNFFGDSIKKLQPIGSHCVLACTGTIIDADSRRNERLDVYALLSKYIADNVPEKSDLKAFEPGIKNALSNAFMRVLERTPKDQWLQVPWSGDIIVTAVVFKYSIQARSFSVTEFNVHVRPNDPNPIFVDSKLIENNALHRAKAILYGSGSERLLSDKTRYGNVRGERWMDRTLVHPVPTSQVDRNEALCAGANYIALLYFDQRPNIGNVVDALCLSPNGITWCAQGEYVDQVYQRASDGHHNANQRKGD